MTEKKSYYTIIDALCIEISPFHLIIGRIIFSIFWIISQIHLNLEIHVNFVHPLWQKKYSMLSLSDDHVGWIATETQAIQTTSQQHLE